MGGFDVAAIGLEESAAMTTHTKYANAQTQTRTHTRKKDTRQNQDF